MIRYGPDFAPRGVRAATDHIVVHCAATRPSVNVTAAAIVRYHMEAKGWRSCGYHDVIEVDGRVVPTLHMNAIGAHVGDIGRGWNGRSYGVCLIGGIDADGRPAMNFTPAQMKALADLLHRRAERWPGARVVGHRDLIREHGASPKACPCFDVIPWWRDLDAPPADDVPPQPKLLVERRSWLVALFELIANLFRRRSDV